MKRLAPLLAVVALLAALPAAAAQKKILFDNTKAETAGNADWIIDDNQPLPVPDQSTITMATDRKTWNGAISSYGIDLAKRGYYVATLTTGYGITYGNSSNPYDLSKYDAFVVPEPNILFNAAEATAILNFVHDGGGLIAIADHSGSDRNNDGYDSPMIWNALDPTHLLGVHFGVSGDANNNIVQTSTNVNAAASDSIIRGPIGNVTGLAFHNGTTFTLYPSVNPTVRGEVWMAGFSGTTGVMAASSQYGSGRVFFIGDSSPVDDGSATAGNSSIYDGWGEAGATDSTLFMNATLWAMRRGAAVADTTPPAVSVTSPNGGEDWKVGSSHPITWTATDDGGVTSVDLAWSSTGAAPWTAITTGIANVGSYSWAVPAGVTTTARVRVTARDAAGNAGADSSAAAFTIDYWTVTATAGAGGIVSPSGVINVVQNANRNITVTPNTGYRTTDVVVDGASVGAVTSYLFTSVNANHTLVASFAANPYSLTVNVVGSGTATRSPDQPSYPYGTAVLLDATPAAGWAFAGWSGDLTAATDTATIVIDAAHVVTATFRDAIVPSVALLAPQGGEQWYADRTQTIRWTASDNVAVDSVNVDWSASGPGGPWTALAHGVSGVDSLVWQPPASPTDNAFVRVTAFDHALNQAAAQSDSAFHVLNQPVSVGLSPTRLDFARPQPNPARGAVTLAFSLPAAMPATLEVLDVSGRRVATLAQGAMGPGVYSLRWSGRDAAGLAARSGVYFARLVTPGRVLTRRFVLME